MDSEVSECDQIMATAEARINIERMKKKELIQFAEKLQARALSLSSENACLRMANADLTRDLAVALDTIKNVELEMFKVIGLGIFKASTRSIE